MLTIIAAIVIALLILPFVVWLLTVIFSGIIRLAVLPFYITDDLKNKPSLTTPEQLPLNQHGFKFWAKSIWQWSANGMMVGFIVCAFFGPRGEPIIIFLLFAVFGCVFGACKFFAN